MRWDGTLWSREQFLAKLAQTTIPPWFSAIVVHSVASPDMRTARETPYRQGNVMAKGPDMDKAFSQRMRNFKGRLNDLGGKGWHFTVFENGKIGEGEPMNAQGSHASSWNPFSYGLEMCFNGDSSDPLTEGGKRIIDTSAWICAQILMKARKPANYDTVRFHHNEAAAKRKGKTCPGKNVDTAAFLKAVQVYMKQEPVGEMPPKTVWVNTPDDNLNFRVTRNGEIRGKLPHGTRLSMSTLFEGWAYVQTPAGYKGWVAWNYLSATEPKIHQPVPPKVQTPEAPKVLSNPNQLLRILTTEADWPEHWARGAKGQAQRESYPDLRPTAAGDWMLDGKPVLRGTPGAKPTAFTIWQLRNDRWDSYQVFAKAEGKLWDDFDTQVRWLPFELKASEKLAWEWLQRADTIEQACAAMVWYERPRGYISKHARACKTWDDVMAVSEKCDGWSARLSFAKQKDK